MLVMADLFLYRWQLHVIAIHVPEEGVITCRCPELIAFERHFDPLGEQRLEMSVAIRVPWVRIGKPHIVGSIIGILCCTLDVFPEIMTYPNQSIGQGSNLPFQWEPLEGSCDDADAMMKSHALIGLSLEGIHIVWLTIERKYIDVDTYQLADRVVDLFNFL